MPPLPCPALHAAACLQVRKGVSKFHEATDPAGALSKEEFVDDLAMTSMARLWDVGRTEPIKVSTWGLGGMR
jgi:hypothetical protein